ncbi:GAF domain-containing protein [Nostoc sp. CCY0012]|uniref:GAF domain-containing protein n=1 Tax=Nostoc sp. CCY0012 TaxID=1056123 RepID=UPI0039C5B935
MSLVNLKKIFHKKELPPLLEELVYQLKIAIDVELADGTQLITIGKQTANKRYPVEVSGEIIGWVIGEEKVSLVAMLLSLLAKQEAEKKELAKELLERYQEIDLFEDISTQLTTSLNKRQVAQMVLQEMSQLIESSAGMILLFTGDTPVFEVIAEYGLLLDHSQPQLSKGIIDNIIQSGRAELINDVPADARSQGQEQVSALICNPTSPHFFKALRHLVVLVLLSSS